MRIRPRGLSGVVCIPTLDVALGPLRCNAYRFFGAAGFVAATGTGLLLTSAQHLPLRPALLLALTAALVFLLLVAATKVVAGTEYIVYFHHEVAILASGATLLWALGVPALPYLDITAIGVLVFLGFGRAGCLMVGCCHGRTAPFGVRYGTRHVAAGFPGQLAGVTLAPVQSLESVTAFAVAGFGVHLALWGAPGSALEWCLLAYGAARFFLLEPLRGDRRPSLLGLSHAQWVAAARAAATLVAMGTGMLAVEARSLALAAAPCLALAARVGGLRLVGRKPRPL